MKRHLWIWLIISAISLAAAREQDPELGANYAAPAGVGRELIGTKAPEWALTDWMGGEPRTLASLRGRVVLVRWWTAPGCPYCAASADALNEFARKYGGRGLSVIGIYHHKENTPLTREHVAGQAKRLGFTFPVAIDRDWKSLHAWWLDRVEAGWTSVTFVVDREGIIRHIHPGGAFFAGEPGFATLDDAVNAALTR